MVRNITSNAITLLVTALKIHLEVVSSTIAHKKYHISFCTSPITDLFYLNFVKRFFASWEECWVWSAALIDSSVEETSLSLCGLMSAVHVDSAVLNFARVGCPLWDLDVLSFSAGSGFARSFSSRCHQ